MQERISKPASLRSPHPVLLLIFGTNIDEVFRTREELGAGLARDFASMGDIRWGEVRNFHVQAGEADAMALVELPISHESNGKAETVMFRYALAMKNESGAWKICAGAASVPAAAGNYTLAA
jgi:hypothetical protein